MLPGTSDAREPIAVGDVSMRAVRVGFYGC
jgi:hypothetical protein